MTKILVNLTGSVVIEEIERLLEDCPKNHPYRSAFSTTEFKRQLIDFILRKIPNRYTVLEDNQGRRIYPDFQGCSLEQRLHIEDLIREGIPLVMQDYQAKSPSQAERNAAFL